MIEAGKLLLNLSAMLIIAWNTSKQSIGSSPAQREGEMWEDGIMVMFALPSTFTVDLGNYSQIIHISLSYNIPTSASFDFSVFSNFNSSILNSWFLVSYKYLDNWSFIAFCLLLASVIRTGVFGVMLSQGGLAALVAAVPECLVNFLLELWDSDRQQVTRCLPMESLRTKLLN